MTWYVCKTFSERLAAEDSWFAFKKRVTIVYPARTIGDSYANGLNRTVYLKSTGNLGGKNDQWDIPTIIHEMMHIWNYDHNHGMSNWLAAVLWDFTTHNFQERQAIAFHEGFAEYAKHELLHEIWGFDKVKPLSRKGLFDYKIVRKELVAKPLEPLSVLERNEKGVRNALQLLSTPNIYKWVFGTLDKPLSTGNLAQSISITKRGCPESPKITFWDVLSVFKPNADAGWPTAWEARQSSGIFSFYDRASDILPEFSQETKDLYIELLTQSSSVQPQSKCSGLTPRRPRRHR